MTDFSYLKQAIKQAGVTLQQLADQCGVTKGYLSQLINNKIKVLAARSWPDCTVRWGSITR